MPSKPPTLSTSARAVLAAAVAHPEHLALTPTGLPTAAARSVLGSLLRAGLVEEVAGESHGSVLRVTAAGLAAVGPQPAPKPPTAVPDAAPDPGNPEPAPVAVETPTPAPVARIGQDAARAMLATLRRIVAHVKAEPTGAPSPYDGAPCPDEALLHDAQRAVAGAMARQPAAGHRKPAGTPRADTKGALVLALLRRPEGASGPALIEATGWAPHTVRGFLAGLAKRGITVTVLERVKQGGPGQQGARGSYTAYRVAT